MFKSFAGNIIAAFGAVAKFAVMNALQRCFGLGYFGFAPTRGGIGHGLLLHRIHARQTPYGGLIKRYCIAAGRCGSIEALQFSNYFV